MLTACASAPHADRPSNVPVDLASAPACHAQVIMTFTEDLGERPADAFVSQIARAANVVLVFVRTAGPGLYVYQLDAGATDDGCDAPLTRLRRDERVRSVDLDRRRTVHDRSNAAEAPGLPFDHSHIIEARDA